MTIEEINVDKIKTIEDCDLEIIKREASIARKLKLKSQIEGDKRENAAAFRDQIKAIKEDLETELGIRDELMTRKLVLSGTKLLGDNEDKKEAQVKNG